MKTWTAPSFGDHCRSGRTQRTDKSTKLTGGWDTSERARDREVARAGKRKQAGQGRKEESVTSVKKVGKAGLNKEKSKKG